MVFGDTLFSKIILKFYVFGAIHTLTFNLIWSYYCLFSDLCVFKYVFGSNVFHSGILELSPNEYSWRLWLPYCNFAKTNRSYGNTASFLYYVHDTIYIVVSWKSFAKIKPNYKCKWNYIPYTCPYNPLLIRNRSWILTIHKAKGHST